MNNPLCMVYSSSFSPLFLFMHDIIDEYPLKLFQAYKL